MRLCATVGGFRSLHGRWPTEVHLRDDACYEEIAGLFRPATFEKITSELVFVIDGKLIVATDAEGRSYSYGGQGFPKERPEQTVGEWLGVSPDGFDNALGRL